MMYIEGHWENVDDLRDVIRIVREYYNPHLADAADKLLEDFIDACNQKIDELTYYDWDDDDCYDD